MKLIVRVLIIMAFVALVSFVVVKCGGTRDLGTGGPLVTEEVAPADPGINTADPGTGETVTEPTPGARVEAPPLVIDPAACPTNAEFQAIFGADFSATFTGGVPWDTCKWNWAAGNLTATKREVPEGWQATLALTDGTVKAFYGPTDALEFTAGTFRYLGVYNTPATDWAQDPCSLLQKENEYSMTRKPAYETLAGNFEECEAEAADNTSITPNPAVVAGASNEVKNSTAATTSNTTTPSTTGTGQGGAPEGGSNDNSGATSTSACPQTVAQVASLVGGSAASWKAPDWEGGAWVYKSSDFATLSVPTIAGANTWIDYWNGQLSKADKLNPGQGLSLADASFHCHP